MAEYRIEKKNYDGLVSGDAIRKLGFQYNVLYWDMLKDKYEETRK